jgi:glycosyltransferase involved in cell wall biosynthesis
MKIGIYSPYLNTLGGGERYILLIASYLANQNTVHLFWDDKSITKKARLNLNINLERVNIIPNIFSNKNNLYKLLKKLKKTREYNILFYVTDGSLFFSLAKKNILIIHAPSHFPPKNSLINILKLKNWSTILCYSGYIQKFIKAQLKRDALIIYPPIAVDSFIPGIKKNIILSVGRFFGGKPHSKKQDFLFNTFKELINEGLQGWQLIFAGVADKTGEIFAKKLQKKIKNYPISIKTNLPFSLLKNLYSSAKVYWHATGFGEDLKKFPEKAEHFGITTAEAMAAGCVPVVINSGAQPEIVTDKKNGYLFNTKNELKQKTLSLMKNQNILKKLSRAAQKTVQKFSEQNFYQNIDDLVKN